MQYHGSQQFPFNMWCKSQQKEDVPFFVLVYQAVWILRCKDHNDSDYTKEDTLSL